MFIGLLFISSKLLIVIGMFALFLLLLARGQAYIRRIFESDGDFGKEFPRKLENQAQIPNLANRLYTCRFMHYLIFTTNHLAI